MATSGPTPPLPNSVQLNEIKALLDKMTLNQLIDVATIVATAQNGEELRLVNQNGKVALISALLSTRDTQSRLAALEADVALIRQALGTQPALPSGTVTRTVTFTGFTNVASAPAVVENLTQKTALPMTLAKGDTLTVQQGDVLRVNLKLVKDFTPTPFTIEIPAVTADVSVPIEYSVGAYVCPGKLILKFSGNADTAGAEVAVPMRVRNETQGFVLDTNTFKTSHVFDRNILPGDKIVFEPQPLSGYKIPDAQTVTAAATDQTVTFSYASTAVPTAPVVGTAAPSTIVVPSNALNLRTWPASRGYSIGQTGTSDDSTALLLALDEARRLGVPVYLPTGVYGTTRRIVIRDWANLVFIMDKDAKIKALSLFTGNPGDESGILSFNRCNNLRAQGGDLTGVADRTVVPISSALRVETLRVTNSTLVLIDQVVSHTAHSAAFAADNCDQVTFSWNNADYPHGQGVGTGTCTNVKINYNYTDHKWTTGYTDHGGIGIFDYHGNGVEIANNTVRNTPGTATKTEGSSNVTYRGNTVDGYGRDAIKVMIAPNSGQPVLNAVAENNTCLNYRRLEPVGGSAVSFEGVVGGRITGNKATGPGLTPQGSGIAVVEFQGVRSKDVTVTGNDMLDYELGYHIRNSDNINGTDNKARSSSGRRQNYGLYLDGSNGTTWNRLEVTGANTAGVGSWNYALNADIQNPTFTDVAIALNGGGTNVKFTNPTYGASVTTQLGGGNGGQWVKY